MQISIKVVRGKDGLAGAAQLKQYSFATANAMNRTLDESQAAMRAGIRQRFTVRGRSAGFIDRLVKRRREDFATRDRLVARIRIEGPENDLARGAILARHEEGGLRTAGRGGYSIDPSYRVQGQFFLPTGVLRSNPSEVIARAMYPANLRLAPRRDISGGMMSAKVHKTRTGKLQLKGKRRTFVLFAAHGGAPIGIYQRGDGSGGRTHSEDFHRIWSYRKTIRLKPRRLEFFPTIRSTVQQRYQLNLGGFLRSAFRTAK
jgi:hypothetical protein